MPMSNQMSKLMRGKSKPSVMLRYTDEQELRKTTNLAGEASLGMHQNFSRTVSHAGPRG
jgi:hypothetical protein